MRKNLQLSVLLFFIPGILFSQYNVKAYLNYAKEDFDKGRFSEAIHKLNICLEAEPANVEAAFYRGASKYSLYDNLGAEEDFTKAIAFFSPYLYDAYHNRANVRYRLQNFTGAMEDINKVIAKQNNSPRLFTERAFIKLAIADYRGTLDDCNSAIYLKDSTVEVFLCKAAAYDAMSDYDSALVNYNVAMKIKPEKSDSYARRGITYNNKGDYKAALSDFDKAIKIDSLNTLAIYSRAETNSKIYDYKSALKDYNRVIDLEPRNSYAYFNRAVLYVNTQKYKNAIADFDKVISINPDNIQAYFNRAKVKQNTKDYKNAIKDYDKVIALYPYVMEAYYNRAQIKLLLKDSSAAKKDFETGKLMSEVFHSKTNLQMTRDSVLLSDLNRLSANFNAVNTGTNDSLDIGFHPMICIAVKKENVPGYYSSPLLSKLNNRQQKVFYFTTYKDNNIFNKDSIDQNSKEEKLRLALIKTNAQLPDAAADDYNEIIHSDSLNAIAFFARGINTWRLLEMNENKDNDYIVAGTAVDFLKTKRNEKLQSAILDFSKSIAIDPSFSFAYYNRANLKCILKNFDSALHDYEKAIQLNPDFADAYYNRALLLYFLNQKDLACKDLSRAGELGLKESYSMMKNYCAK